MTLFLKNDVQFVEPKVQAHQSSHRNVKYYKYAAILTKLRTVELMQQ